MFNRFFLILWLLHQTQGLDAGPPTGAPPTKASTSNDAVAALRTVAAEAFKTPEMKWIDQEGPVDSLTYAGESYNGQPTSVFAFYASPATIGDDNHQPEDQYPAVVLIHGGGGTAFAEWVWLWANRGYAAIAMDLSGSRPPDPIYDAAGRPVTHRATAGNAPTRLPDGGPRHGLGEKFDSIGGDVSDDWPRHAVGNVLRAHSLIRSFAEVDPERTAVTGISWGGYTTCLAASLDPRFKAAVPVYGCGFLHEGESVQKSSIDKLGDRREAWIAAYDPSSLLGECRVPILFVNGTNDKHYPLDSYQKSYDLVAGFKQMRIEVNMRHSHPSGWAPPEIGLFIDSFCRGGVPLPKVSTPEIQSGSLMVAYQSEVPASSASLHYTIDTKARSERAWQSIPATIRGSTISSPLPPSDANTWFLSLTDQRGAMVTTSIEFQPAIRN